MHRSNSGETAAGPSGGPRDRSRLGDQIRGSVSVIQYRVHVGDQGDIHFHHPGHRKCRGPGGNRVADLIND